MLFDIKVSSGSGDPVKDSPDRLAAFGDVVLSEKHIQALWQMLQFHKEFLELLEKELF
jgi:hypothetical protein